MQREFLNKYIYVLLILCLSGIAAFPQNKIQQKLPEKTRVLFVLDGSGSMEALWDSKDSRMDVAKRILTKLVDSLRVNNDLELALRVYGHRYSRQANNCNDSKLEVPFAAKNHNAIISKIQEIQPRGVTPISNSLLQAANDFPAGKGYRNILILITDGIESCGTDPCAVSMELQKKGVFLRPFIIGLGIKGGKVLECVGKFLDSQSENSFNQSLNETISTTFAKTTVSIELLNGQNQPKESNVNVTFKNSMTGLAAYEFVHYLDKNGRPDSVQIDPVLGYDVVVNTVPPVILKDILIKNGEHNVLTIPAAQGSLLVKYESSGPGFTVLVKEPNQKSILNAQRNSQYYRYLEGTYQLEVLTLPKRYFDVDIEADKLKTITLPQPGLVNINSISAGYGSLFEILPSGESKWVCDLQENTSMHSYNLLPGSYKVTFRVKQAAGSKFTAIKLFDVKPGTTLNLSIF